MLQLNHIKKEYKTGDLVQKALDDVSLNLRDNEFVAILGPSGSGKTTLLNVIGGLDRYDSGDLIINGISTKKYTDRDWDSYRNHTIGFVFQSYNLIPHQTVLSNVELALTISGISGAERRSRATKALEQVGLGDQLHKHPSEMSGGQMQRVAIASVLVMRPDVMILDEPTSSLDEQEVTKLFGLMRDLKARGVGIIFVTHFLDQVYEVCDKITVMRDGSLVGEYAIKDLPRVQLVSKMLGKELDDLSDIKGEQPTEQKTENGEPLFETKDLCSDAGIRPFDFYIKKGEVNGFTGLLGSGRSECVRAIFGADRVIGGTVKKNGKQVKINKPLDAMRCGIGYLPEDRKRDGIVGDLSVRENIILALQVLRGFFHPISKAEANKFADEYIKLLDIKTASAETPIKSLSGGNQQKVILARWLLTHPEYLILDEPTRGIDVGTKVDIQKLVLKLASEGMSVTFISSETDEMLRTCSRLVVMRDRKVVGELSGEDLTQTKIMSTIAGGESKHE